MKIGIFSRRLALFFLLFLIFPARICLAGNVPDNKFISQWSSEKTNNKIIKQAQNDFMNGLFEKAIVDLSAVISSKKIHKRERALIYVGLASSWVEISIRKNNNYQRRAYCYQAMDYFNEALKLIEKEDKLNISINSGLGFLYSYLDEYLKAKFYLEKALTYPIGDYKKEYMDICTSLGNVNLRMNNYAKASMYFNEVMRTVRDLFVAQLRKKSCPSHELNEKQIAALVEKYNFLFLICQEAGYSRRDFCKFHIYLDSLALSDKFKDYIRQSRFRQNYQEKDLNGKRAYRFLRLGYLSLGLENYTQAIENFKLGLGLMLEDYQVFPFYLGLAATYNELSEHEQSMDILKKGLEYLQDKPGIDCFSLSLKQYELASEFLSQVLMLDSNNPARVMLLNSLNKYLESRNLPKMLPSLSRYARLPGTINASLANIAFDYKFYRLAAVNFNYALVSPISDKDKLLTYLKIGIAYKESGDYRRAARYLDKGLSLPLASPPEILFDAK